jgi:cytochrome b561/polyisoprenoid-binding protein YceI
MTARYSSVAIALHWLTALAILAMIPMGWWMSEAITDPDNQATAYRVFQLHKSIGLTILGLTVLRIGWRLTHRAPPLPEGMKGWEAFLARATQFAFYGLLLALPLTGWLYVSTGWAAGLDRALNVATSWFGLLSVPHLPGIPDLATEARRALAFQAMSAHGLMAWGAVILVGLHAGAALKHHFIDRDDVLRDMLPGRRTRSVEVAPVEPADAPTPDRAVEDVSVEPAPAEAAVEPAASPRRRRAPGAAMAAGLALTAAMGVVGWTTARPPASTQTAAPAETPSAQAAPETAIVPGTAQAWTIDRKASSIQFAGTHAGAAFTGRFEDWEGRIWFDPADLAGSRAAITIRTGSARTGDATQEGSLQEAEWLDPAGFPTARFDATGFRALGGDRYEARGTLRIKDRTVPTTLAFTFRETAGQAVVEGTATLDRAAFDLGLASDAAGDWVSKAITVTVAVRAARAR